MLIFITCLRNPPNTINLDKFIFCEKISDVMSKMYTIEDGLQERFERGEIARRWIDARMSHIENNVTTGFIHLDTEKERYNYIIEEIHNDLVVLFHHIKPQQTLSFFNFRKKERACLCPVCILSVQEIYSDCKQTDHFLKTLQQAPENNHLSCFVCGHKAKYIGVCNDEVDGDPERDECFGETVDLQSGECLWCSRNQ
jgi:hypothetical protein